MKSSGTCINSQANHIFLFLELISELYNVNSLSGLFFLTKLQVSLRKAMSFPLYVPHTKNSTWHVVDT